jgi:uncharacterized membrane protein YbhN (UPF0104 family)
LGEFDTSVGKQPLPILYAGYVAVALIFGISLIFAPSGLNAWVPYLGIWFFSVVAYLAPFTIFVLANGKVERKFGSLKYESKTVNLVRFGLLLFGILASTVISFFLATEISKALNAG